MLSYVQALFQPMVIESEPPSPADSYMLSPMASGMGAKSSLLTVELFAGIGGFRIACDNLGIETVWANDIKSDACGVYRNRFGSEEIVEGDISALKTEFRRFGPIPIDATSKCSP